MVAALLLFTAGIVLSNLLTQDARNFEFKLQQAERWRAKPSAAGEQAAVLCTGYSPAPALQHVYKQVFYQGGTSMAKPYDYLIVGAGLFGAVFARQATKAGRKCLVIDKRDHIAGNIYTESIEGIQVHRYGAHIFHTNNKRVWDYVNEFAVFNRYTNSPVANYHGELYNLPLI